MSNGRREHPLVAALAADPVIPHLVAAIEACEEGEYKEQLLDLLHARNLAVARQEAARRGGAMITFTGGPSARTREGPATGSSEPRDD